MEHPLNPHKSYAYPPRPRCAAPQRVQAGQRISRLPRPTRAPCADAPPHAADHRRAVEVLRVLEASSNLNSFLQRGR